MPHPPFQTRRSQSSIVYKRLVLACLFADPSFGKVPWEGVGWVVAIFSSSVKLCQLCSRHDKSEMSVAVGGP